MEVIRRYACRKGEGKGFGRLRVSRCLGVAADRVALLAHLADLVPVKRFLP